MTPIVGIIFIILAIIFVILICRELTCWYFKINKIEKLLEEILKQLRKTNKL